MSSTNPPPVTPPVERNPRAHIFAVFPGGIVFPAATIHRSVLVRPGRRPQNGLPRSNRAVALSQARNRGA